MKTVKIQRRGGSSPWTRPSTPGCGDTLMASASFGSIKGGRQGNLAPGSLSTGSPAGRTPLLFKQGDGSMCSLAYVRARILHWFGRSCLQDCGADVFGVQVSSTCLLLSLSLISATLDFDFPENVPLP